MIAHEQRHLGPQMSETFVGCGNGVGKRRHGRPLEKSLGDPGRSGAQASAARNVAMTG